MATLNPGSPGFHEDLNTYRSEYARVLVEAATAKGQAARTLAVVQACELAQTLGREASSDEARTRKLMSAKKQLASGDPGKIEAAKAQADADLVAVLRDRLIAATKLVRANPTANDLRRAIAAVEAMAAADRAANSSAFEKHNTKWMKAEAAAEAKGQTAREASQQLAVAKRLIDEAEADKIYNAVLSAIPTK